MPQTINVPGVGQLQFPDGMSDVNMAAAIQKNFPQIHGQQAAPAQNVGPDGQPYTAAQQSTLAALPSLAPSAQSAAALGDTMKGLAIGAGRTATGMAGMPIDLLRQIVPTAQNNISAMLGNRPSATVPQAGSSAAAMNARLGLGPSSNPGIEDAAAGGQAAATLATMGVGGGAAAAQEGTDLVATAPKSAFDALLAEHGADPEPLSIPLARQTLVNARKEGYMVTPKYADNPGGIVGTTASTSGSEVKMQQALSGVNDKVTSKLAAHDLGIPDGQPLTPAAVDAVDNKANAIYKLVRNTGDVTPNADYAAAVKNIGSRSEAVDKAFGSDTLPEIQQLKQQLSINQPVDAGAILDKVSELRQQARNSYQAIDNRNVNQRLGSAQRQAADALEGLLEDHLEQYGGGTDSGVYQAFQLARTMKAKIATVRNAMNDATGSVDPFQIAREYDNGAPLTGGLKTIAMTAKAFPKVMQNPTRLPTSGNATMLDKLLMGHGIMTGNVPQIVAGAARPFARARVATEAYQDNLVNPQASALDAILQKLQDPNTRPLLFGAAANADARQN